MQRPRRRDTGWDLLFSSFPASTTPITFTYSQHSVWKSLVRGGKSFASSQSLYNPHPVLLVLHWCSEEKESTRILTADVPTETLSMNAILLPSHWPTTATILCPADLLLVLTAGIMAQSHVSLQHYAGMYLCAWVALLRLVWSLESAMAINSRQKTEVINQQREGCSLDRWEAQLKSIANVLQDSKSILRPTCQELTHHDWLGKASIRTNRC